MDIPKSLENIWNKVSSDGFITKEDYNSIVKEVAPNGLTEEIDKEEEKFLQNLYSKLSKDVNKGKIPVSEILLNSDKSYQEKTNVVQVDKNKLSEVPMTLKEKWNQIISDNKITPSEYKLLLEAASPNWTDEELDDNEKNFLSNLKSLIKDSKTILELKESSFNNNHELTSDDLRKINEILKDFEDEPDFKPIKKIVNDRLDKLLLLQDFNKKVDEIVKNSNFNDKNSLIKSKSKITDLLSKLPDTLKNSENVKSIFNNSIKILDEGIKNLSNNPQQNNNTNQVSNNYGFNIPNSLKATWNEVSKKGVINADDFEKLKLAAAPNRKNAEFDDEEINFLAELYDKMEQNGGSLTLNSNSNSQQNNNTNQVSNNENKFTMLLNWPGYNKETKSALKNAFPNEIIMSNDMPLLTTKKAKEISSKFNLNSITELQRLVGAKVDGKFGPETFFKVKVYLANQINNNSMPKENIMSILNTLGNDKEVNKMKEFLSNN
ncbi:MAG: hypothetical protein KatS3mg068_1148 [Candidatus Sericytochromatia bacterium]|nr:MAG: hypothetical protein KatS3mg068_1148 [Candidatus Sericytochromatia bacterium]